MKYIFYIFSFFMIVSFLHAEEEEIIEEVAPVEEAVAVTELAPVVEEKKEPSLIFSKSSEQEASQRYTADIANSIDKDYSFLYDQIIDPNLQRDIATNPENYVALYLNQTNIILIQLYTKESQEAVERFKRLIVSGYYNKTEFFRLVPNYLIQAGDPTNSGYGGKGELHKATVNNGLKFDRGTVAFANNGNLESDDTQFFITFNSFDWLDNKYTIIGRVISGIDLLDSFEGSYLNDGFLDNPIIIEKITLLYDYSSQQADSTIKVIQDPIKTKGDRELDSKAQQAMEIERRRLAEEERKKMFSTIK